MREKNEPGGDPEAKAIGRALIFIRHRDRSSGEVRERLRTSGFDHETISRVVLKLEDERILDDSRFARTYMDELIGKGYGFYRVREKLTSMKLSRELVDEVMEEYPLELEAERACEIGRNRTARLTGDRESRCRRLQSYLLRLGFSKAIADDVSASLCLVDTDFRPE